MQVMVLFLFVAIVIGSTQSQTWAGTYMPDSSCDTSTCCCLSGQAIVTSSSANSYTVQSGASGVCGGAVTFTGNLYTSGYTGWMMVATDNDTVTLSSDSHIVTVTNPSRSACNGQGIKNGSPTQHVNIITYVIGYFLVGMVINTLIA
ncbi:hypothetical protein I4U23_022064 [Adineta vaga]|nr:hypothetical protein I4U23_022064 [Adineta vaga]